MDEERASVFAEFVNSLEVEPVAPSWRELAEATLLQALAELRAVPAGEGRGVAVTLFPGRDGEPAGAVLTVDGAAAQAVMLAFLSSYAVATLSLVGIDGMARRIPRPAADVRSGLRFAAWAAAQMLVDAAVWETE